MLEPYYLPQDVIQLQDELHSCLESMGYILSHYPEFNTPAMRQAWEDLAKSAKDFAVATLETLQEAQN